MARKKILVVDDNHDNRRILVHNLGKLGDFEIREATDGKKAVEAVEADWPDLIFMDIRMPVMSGLDATRQIRAMQGQRALRIVALSAQGAADVEERALAVGCDDYLPMPVFGLSALRQKIKPLLAA